MAISPSDPAFKLIYGLDESGSNSTRVNAGSGGSTHDLSVSQSSGTDGIGTVADGRGGKALDVFATRSGWSSAQRGCKGTIYNPGSTHPLRVAYPISSATDDFAYGARVYFRGLNTGGGGVEPEHVFGLKSAGGNVGAWGMMIVPNDATTPVSGKVRVYYVGSQETIDSGSYTTTGSPPTNYILKNEWYRLLIRVYYNGSGYTIKLYVYRESTGETFTFTKNANLTTDYSTGFDTSTDVRLWISVHNDATCFPLGGYIDECWLYDAAMSDTDATQFVVGGLTVPWSEPNYRVADHDVRVTALLDRGTSFPIPRELPTGQPFAKHVLGTQFQRLRLKYEGFRPGRPFGLRRIDAKFDTLGPWSAQRGRVFSYDRMNMGLFRVPGRLPPGACVDVRNMEFVSTGCRRRRGYRVRRNVNASFDYAMNQLWTWRDSSDVLYRLYKVGSSLYADDGSSALSIDTGWGSVDQAVAQALDNRLWIISAQRRKTWRGSNTAVESFGIANAAAPTLALAAGTLSGTYYYMYTEYDPTTGDESGGTVSAAVSPSAQGVTLTMAAVNSDTRFSQRRIYRTTAGGAAPNLFLIATITSATSYTDSGLADGTTQVGVVTDTDGGIVGYITGNPPDTFIGCCVHQNRMFYWTAGNRFYWSEAGEPMRFFSNASQTTEYPVTAIVSRGYQVIVFTTKTVEIFESDWGRDDNGDYAVRRTVISRNVGTPGPHCVVDHDDKIYWFDRRGIYRLNGDQYQKISGDKIDNLFLYLNSGYAKYISGAYNHLRNQIWWVAPFGSIQDDNTRFQTIIVLHMDQPDDPKWTIHQVECCFITQFDDDLNGVRFGGMDHLGIFKEFETYEGDGAEGNESYTTEDDDGVSSVSTSTVTVSGSPGWTTNALRGMGVILRDVATGNLYYYVIASNTASTFTVIGTVDSSIGSLDGYYIGGMRAFIELAEQDFDTPNRKVVRDLSTEFDMLTLGRFI